MRNEEFGRYGLRRRAFRGLLTRGAAGSFAANPHWAAPTTPCPNAALLSQIFHDIVNTRSYV